MTPRRAQWALGLVLAALVGLPWARHYLEASMWRHMVIQFPLMIIAGALCAAALPARLAGAVGRWNVKGVSGLVFASIALALLMIPRVLDLALVAPRIEIAKLAALFLIGAAVRLSWRPAGAILQFFFFGNALGMTAIVGMLYLNSPLRLCNAYLLDDQERLGRWLIALAAALAVAWIVRVFWQLAQREQAGAAQSPDR